MVLHINTMFCQMFNCGAVSEQPHCNWAYSAGENGSWTLNLGHAVHQQSEHEGFEGLSGTQRMLFVTHSGTVQSKTELCQTKQARSGQLLVLTKASTARAIQTCGKISWAVGLEGTPAGLMTT